MSERDLLVDKGRKPKLTQEIGMYGHEYESKTSRLIDSKNDDDDDKLVV